MRATITHVTGPAEGRNALQMVERRRHEETPAWLGWIPLVVLPAAACAFRSRLAPWEFMWLLAIALFFGCKFETWFRARIEGAHSSAVRNLGYLFLWPGMDAATFLKSSTRPARPRTRDWLAALSKTLIGVALIAFAARKAVATPSLLDGWVGMLGLILVLHFGTFHLVALAWQTAGVDAQPIMRAPLLATSLSEFWGNRWNLGFRQLSHGIIFQPVRKLLGAPVALLAAFLFSGIVHDLVISFPARGGYGLPTAYFVFQGFGVLVERSSIGARAGIDHGFRGWAFALLWAAAPVYWLFHSAFVTRVMLPFFAALGSHGI